MKNNKAKKYIASVMLSVLILASGCGSASYEHSSPDILCAGFAEYDWARTILGENPAGLTISLLNDSGVDMHSYQPSVADMADISDAELLIYTGGESEFWIEEAVSGHGGNTLRLMDVFEEKGFEEHYYHEDAAISHEHEHEHDHEHEHGHDHETDEHLWLSPKMAPAFIEEISRAISALDPAGKSIYSSNAASLTEAVSRLDASYEKAFSAASSDTIIFADRYPFTYLFQDYGLHAVAAFPGCSAETEASFSTIVTLMEEADKLSPGGLLVLNNSDDSLARTVAGSCNDKDIKILTINSMQSVNNKDISSGVSWLSIMEDNLEVFKTALN